MVQSRMHSLEEINSLSVEQFKNLLGNIVENYPEGSYQVSLKRPFATINEVENAFNDFFDQLNDNEKENILNKHPELKSNEHEEELTLESKNEQNSIGINTISESEKSELIKLNKLYKEKFSFPFIICVRENNIASILLAIKIRFENLKAVEINNAIEEVKKISKFRIRDLIYNNNNL